MVPALTLAISVLLSHTRTLGAGQKVTRDVDRLVLYGLVTLECECCSAEGNRTVRLGTSLTCPPRA